MKNLPEHTPKSESWEKILQQQDFESQLNKASDDLPLFEPKTNAWEAITAQLETEKPIIPIWQKLAAAMVLALAIACAWLILGQKPTTPLDADLVTEIKNVSIPLEVEKPIIEKKGGTVDTAPHAPPVKDPTSVQINLGIAEVDAPSIALPDIEIPRQDFGSIPNPNQVTASTQIKSRHEVDISWGLDRSKLKVKTNFGKPSPDLEAVPSTQTASSKTIQIRFKN